jgi:hypothetical protein
MADRNCTSASCYRRLAAPLIFILALAGFAPVAFALITGGTGNDPIRDPGWPAGAADIFNNPARVAYWEGPPFGGGQWHAECRGDTATLNDVLKVFAKVEAKTKRIVAHDGVGRSFWLNPNNEPAKADAAKIDWIVMVWQEDRWDALKDVPVSIRPRDVEGDQESPPMQIEIYTGGNIRWDDVIVPAGIEVIDEQLEAHGFKAEDGTVIEGCIIDLSEGKPLAARIELQLMEQKKKGGYEYKPTLQTDADAKGRWVLTKVPAGWFRIVASADGYVPRVVGFVRPDGQPRWQSYDSGLSRSAVVAGRVIDEDGKPLADVEVKLYDVASHDREYDKPDDYRTTTDAKGRFRFEQVPLGSARTTPHKDGYCRPGLGETIRLPNENVELVMKPAGQLRVTVEFRDEVRRGEYIVNLEPEGGNVVGSWGGSAQINEKNQYTFANVPPGEYFVDGHPNPTSDKERTERVAVELKGGATVDVTLKAK